MRVLALDPGYECSQLVSLDGARITSHLFAANDEVLAQLQAMPASDIVLVIEQVESFGMAVGKEVFETVFWAGRFAQAWAGTWTRLPRTQVKLALCQSRKAKDPEIRQALLDRYGPGKERAIGLKHSQGPLYGISGHAWAALALGVAYQLVSAGELKPCSTSTSALDLGF